MPPAERWYCRYGKCGEDDDEAEHSPGCLSHPQIHKSVVAEATLKKVKPAFCCRAHRKRQLENEYRDRRRKRERALSRAPIGRRIAASAADSIDPNLAAWKRSDQ